MYSEEGIERGAINNLHDRNVAFQERRRYLVEGDRQSYWYLLGYSKTFGRDSISWQTVEAENFFLMGYEDSNQI